MGIIILLISKKNNHNIEKQLLVTYRVTITLNGFEFFNKFLVINGILF